MLFILFLRDRWLLEGMVEDFFKVLESEVFMSGEKWSLICCLRFLFGSRIL